MKESDLLFQVTLYNCFVGNNVMRKAILVALLALQLGVAVGCAGPGERPRDRWNRWNEVTRRDFDALADDIDLVLQTDRPTRMTRWITE